jgi:hypothetical protein
MDLMTVYGTGYLADSPSAEPALYRYIRYDPALDSYQIDAAALQSEAYIGSLTGRGSIPKKGLARDEICLALDYSRFFSTFHRQMPEIAWLYYTSENKFIYMYPEIASNEFSYSDDLKKRYGVEISPSMSGWEILNAVGRKRGFLISGGETDTLRTSKTVLDEFREGKIGRISLERP